MADAIEYNEVNHVGIKPAVDQDSIRVYPRRIALSTQIFNFNEADNATVVLYTVPTGKTAFINNVVYYAYNTSGGVGFCYFGVFNATPTLVSILGLTYFTGDGSEQQSTNFNVPFEIPANYTFKLISGAANVKVGATIYGYTL